jgi:Rad51
MNGNAVLSEINESKLRAKEDVTARIGAPAIDGAPKILRVVPRENDGCALAIAPQRIMNNPYACHRRPLLSTKSLPASGQPDRCRKRAHQDKNHQQASSLAQDQRNSNSNNNNNRNSKKKTLISPTSALQLWRLQQDITSHSSGIHLLSDHCPWTRLDGGRIYELAGAAGTAKTQLALQACLLCAKKGYDCTYLSLKGTRTNTMVHLAHRLNQMIPSSVTHTTTYEQQHDILSRIHLRGIRNGDELANLIVTAKNSSTSTRPMRLLVMDSLADLFRADPTTDYPQRALQFLQLVQSWRRDYPTMPILILNQVTLHDALPALGLTWAHCVNASFLVQHPNGSCRCDGLQCLRRNRFALRSKRVGALRFQITK